jgi:hypothetical protein
LLPTLRADLKRARRSLTIVCPWIDEYFATEVTKAVTAESLDVHVLARPELAVDADVWEHMEAAFACFKDRFPNADIRTLDRLHAKTIVIDGEIGYVCSTNFYRYSLEQSRELGIRGPAKEMGELLGEVEKLINAGAAETTRPTKIAAAGPGIETEILDPIAREILAKNPGAWVVGKRSEMGSSKAGKRPRFR